MPIKEATGPFDTIEKHGPVAGVGVVFVVAGVLISIGSQVPRTIKSVPELIFAVGPFAGFGALLIVVGVGLILFRIGQNNIEKQRLIDEAKDRKKVDQP